MVCKAHWLLPLGLLASGLPAFAAGDGRSGTGSTTPSAEARVAATFQPWSADLPNPERGFYRPVRSTLDALARAEVDAAYADGFRLLFIRIDLAPYRRGDLPAGFLDRLDQGFAAARRGGVKLIARAAYNDPKGETDYQQAQDAPLPRVLAHLKQLKSLFARNADVIAFVQAGFVGAWGEWHTSSNHLTAPDARTRIKDALIDAVPASRFVQFRYPPYIHEWTPQLPTLQRALIGAFRIGFHNDCFLASRTDVGTFDTDRGRRTAQQAYLDRLGDLAPFGAETCNPRDEAGATPRTACNDILAEGARYNLTYLNHAYYRRQFHENWRRHGCLDTVRRKMGYRLALVEASHPAAVQRGQALALSIVVRNSGWARPYNPRGLQIVLRDRRTGAVRRIDAGGADARAWLPGRDSAATPTALIPSDLPAGTHDLLLALPDAAPRLADDARYAIRLANADVPARGQHWDARLGAFALGTSVTIR